MLSPQNHLNIGARVATYAGAMDLELQRCDLLQLNPISHGGTLQLLPISKSNSRQKILVGDDTGMLHCYDFKKGEPVMVFEMQVFENQPVTCVTLGGDNILKQDKIYVSARQQVVGVSKKGKQFFSLSSSSTEAISSIETQGTLIWSACEYICNMYDNGKDKDLYMSLDQINAMSLGHPLHEDTFDVVLACQDSCVRVVNGTELCLDIPTTAPVRSVVLSPRGLLDSTDNYLIVGTDGGELTLVNVNSTRMKSLAKASNKPAMRDDYVYEWTLQDPQHSAVTAMFIADITRGGGDELVIAREDGRVEVYFQDSGDGTAGLAAAPPRKVFSHDLGEKIQGITYGRVNSDLHFEIVVATYSGKVISFTTEPLQKRNENDTYGRSTATLLNESRIKHLEGEINSMRSKVAKERSSLDKAKETKKSETAKARFKSKEHTAAQKPYVLAPAADFSSAVSFVLDPKKGAYVLNIEIQSALDLVVVRSAVELEVVDLDDDSTTLVSVTPNYLLENNNSSTEVRSASNKQDTECKFIAALNVPKDEKRASLAVRPIEGQHGDVLMTIVTKASPKLAKVLKFPIKRLSLHRRLHNMLQEQAELPRCQVKFSGTFKFFLPCVCVCVCLILTCFVLFVSRLYFSLKSLPTFRYHSSLKLCLRAQYNDHCCIRGNE